MKRDELFLSEADTTLQNSGRRRFLGGLAAGAATLLLPETVGASEAFWAHPRMLSLYRPSTRERWEGCYWRDGRVDAGYAYACSLMRDVKAGQVAAISPRLLDLLCAIQAWVKPYGYTAPIHINSGYRTAKTNAGLEGAAKQSMHLRGEAADIVLPGLPAAYLGKLAAHYQGGGVGFYLDSGFVHVDTGRVRYWRR